MKAVIVDLQDQRAAALCEDGSIREIADSGYTPGQTIELPEFENSPVDSPSEEKTAVRTFHKKHRTARPYYRQIAAAAAACFLVLGISAGTVWAMPYGKVYVDNGSSLSYTINRFDYVLEVEADNEAGEEVLEELDMKQLLYHKIDSAVARTLAQMEQSAEDAGEGNTSLTQGGDNTLSEFGGDNAVLKDDGENTSLAAGTDASSPTSGKGRVRIDTDIKNEKHADNLRERLESIAGNTGRASSADGEEEGASDSSGNSEEIGNAGQKSSSGNGEDTDNAGTETGRSAEKGSLSDGQDTSSGTGDRAGTTLKDGQNGDTAGKDASEKTDPSAADPDLSNRQKDDPEDGKIENHPSDGSSDTEPSGHISGDGASDVDGQSHGNPPASGGPTHSGGSGSGRSGENRAPGGSF